MTQNEEHLAYEYRCVLDKLEKLIEKYDKSVPIKEIKKIMGEDD